MAGLCGEDVADAGRWMTEGREVEGGFIEFREEERD